MIVNIDDLRSVSGQPSPPPEGAMKTGQAKQREQDRLRRACEAERHRVARGARGLVHALHDAVRANPTLTTTGGLGEVWRELRLLMPDLVREHEATRALADALGVPFLRAPLTARERAS